jgi:hypothetical protein
MDAIKVLPAARQHTGEAFKKAPIDYSTAQHPYLDRKGIDLAALQAVCKCKVEIRPTTLGDFRGLAVFRELLAVDGSAKGFERILPERITFNAGDKPNDKFTQKGSAVSGTFTPIGFHPSELMSMDCRVIVCAGLADGYRIHEATGEPVACGVGENNVRSIAEAIQPLNPSILVAVDNDDAGKRAGNASGFEWAHPISHKDWSDVYQADGLQAVRDSLAVYIKKPGQEAPKTAKSEVTDAKESRKAAAEAEKEATTSDNLPPFPEDLSDLPHGLGELQSYVFGTMIYPSSAAAGFTALALYTSLAQTHLTIDSMGGLGFNEQYMMLGGTGSGKEGTRKPFGSVHKEIKRKVFNPGAMPQILRSAPSSKQGLHKHLEENNSLVMLSDEFGEWLCTTESGSAKQEALGYLMEIYSSALESVHPGGAVQNNYTPVENPRVMLYTTSTAERMLETMSASQADSGSYNRFVILTMGKEAYPKRYEGFKWEPSRQTMDPLEWLIKQTGVVDVSPEAWERFKAQDKAITDPIKHADPQMGGRLAEQAIKLAGLVALSDKRMKINADDMNVAFSLRVGLYKRTKALFDGEGAISNQHITTKAADQIRAALERKPVLYRSQLPLYSRQYKQLSVAEQNAVVVSLIEDGSMRQSEGSKSRFTSHLFDV